MRFRTRRTLSLPLPPDHSRSLIGGTSRRLTREASRTICCFAPDSAPPTKNPGYALAVRYGLTKRGGGGGGGAINLLFEAHDSYGKSLVFLSSELFFKIRQKMTE